jgi:Wiskott-Aldrich syndrome protein
MKSGDAEATEGLERAKQAMLKRPPPGDADVAPQKKAEPAKTAAAPKPAPAAAPLKPVDALPPAPTPSAGSHGLLGGDRQDDITQADLERPDLSTFDAPPHSLHSDEEEVTVSESLNERPSKPAGPRSSAPPARPVSGLPPPPSRRPLPPPPSSPLGARVPPPPPPPPAGAHAASPSEPPISVDTDEDILVDDEELLEDDKA